MDYVEQAQFYANYWRSRLTGPDELCALFFIREAIKSMHDLQDCPTILDAGCGRGWMTHALGSLGNVLGVDLSVDLAKRFYSHCSFQRGNLAKEILTGHTFDVVVSSEVIEHLSTDDQKAYISNLTGSLRMNGYLVLTTPNKPKALELFAALPRARKQPIENWLTQYELIKLLSRHLQVWSCDTIVHYPLWIRRSVPTNAAYFMFYAYTGIYRLHEMFRARSECPYQEPTGLYHAVIAQKTN